MLLTMIATLAVGASNAPPEATLTWHEFRAGDSLYSSLPRSFYGLYGEGQSIPGYVAPEGLAQPRFFAIYRTNGASIVGVVGRSQEGGAIDKAWVDWNGNKKFESSEQGKLIIGPKLSFGNQTEAFTFSKHPMGPSCPIHANLLVVSDTMVRLDPTGYMTGVIKVGGKATKVALIDTDCKGAFGATGPDAQGVYLALDTGGTGRLDQSGFNPVMALMQIGDGKFWAPEIAKDGSRIKLVLDTSPIGKLAFKGAVLRSIELSNSKGPVMARPSNSEVTVPAGSYTFGYAWFNLKDGSGKEWQYAVRGNPARKLEVKPHGATTVSIGGPLKLAVKAQAAGEGYSFSLSLKDRSGGDVQGLSQDKGGNPPVPQLTISDSEGKVVKTVAFAYG